MTKQGKKGAKNALATPRDKLAATFGSFIMTFKFKLTSRKEQRHL